MRFRNLARLAIAALIALAPQAAIVTAAAAGETEKPRSVYCFAESIATTSQPRTSYDLMSTTPAVELTSPAEPAATTRSVYQPSYNGSWDWPGYPDIELLRYHLKTDAINHPGVNNTTAKLAAIDRMTATELRATHNSDHEYRLDTTRVTEIPRASSTAVPETRPASDLASDEMFETEYVTTTAAQDCPNGMCPTGFGVISGAGVVSRSRTVVAAGGNRVRAWASNRRRPFRRFRCR